jgi:hypothetical protein
MSAVIAILLWPKRSLTIFRRTPASSATLA